MLVQCGTQTPKDKLLLERVHVVLLDGCFAVTGTLPPGDGSHWPLVSMNLHGQAL